MPHVHPLLPVAVLQQQLLVEHVAAYAAVLVEEGGDAASLLRRQVAWQLAAGAAIAVAFPPASVSAMLWTTRPDASPDRVWLLLGVPLLPLPAAAWALRQASRLTAHARHDDGSVRRGCPDSSCRCSPGRAMRALMRGLAQPLLGPEADPRR